MILISYKVLTALYLNRQWGGVGLSRDTLSGFWGTRLYQVFPRLIKQRFIIRDPGSSSVRSGISTVKGQRSSVNGLRLNYLGENKLLERFPLLSYLPKLTADMGHMTKDEEGQMSGVNGQRSKVNGLTLVIFNIPESQRASRDRLRYQLKTLGFGSLSRSVYLSPHLSVKETRALIDAAVNPTGHPELTEGHPELVSGSSISTFEMLKPFGLAQGGRVQHDVLVLSLPPESFEEVEGLERFWDLRSVNDQYERALAAWEVFKDSSKFLNYFITGFLFDPLLPFDATQGKPPPIQPKNALINKCLQIARGIIVG